MRHYTKAIALALLLLFEIGPAMATPLETTTSQRYSVRNYTDQPITSQQLLTLLQNAYGYSGINRVLPKIGEAFSLTLFSINSSGSYIYLPEANSMSVWNAAVTKETINPRLTQSWESGANVIIVIVWNETKMNNGYFAYAEAGCFVQNFYLAAVDSAIGTCCAQTFDADGLKSDLGLPRNMIPLLIMPTGFPTSPYSAATPDYDRMTGNLPPVQNSEKSFTDALSAINFAQTWSTQELSLQEQSQLLWAAYGYASTSHRTTPSYSGWYPLIIYMANATGIFRYLPETHSVTEVQAGDKRSAIATTYANQIWAADAPTVFLVAYNSTVNSVYPEPSWYDSSVEVDAGCVVQQILLESSALSLSTNVVAKGFESWNGTSAQILRETLNIPSSIVPLYIIPVGHVLPTKSSSNINCQVSLDSVALSESLRVSGTLLRMGVNIAAIVGAPVTLTYTKPDASTVNRTVVTSAVGAFFEIYTPDALGNWSVKASWSGNSDTEGAASGLVGFTVATSDDEGPVSTTISCSVSPSSVILNGSLTVYGSISPPVSGATITLIYAKPDASTTARTVTSEGNGSFTSTYAPNIVGNWSVRASWLGDTNHKGSTSSVAVFTVTEETQPPPAGGIPVEIICAVAVIIILTVAAASFLYVKQGKK